MRNEERYHLEAHILGLPNPDGWRTACGRGSASLTNDPEEVDCKSCLKAIARKEREDAAR